MSAANDGAHASLVFDDRGDTDHLIALAHTVIPARRPFGHHVEADGIWYPVETVVDDGPNIIIHYGVDTAVHPRMAWVPIRETRETDG